MFCTSQQEKHASLCDCPPTLPTYVGSAREQKKEHRHTDKSISRCKYTEKFWFDKSKFWKNESFCRIRYFPHEYRMSIARVFETNSCALASC